MREILEKKIRGIPLFVILILCGTIIGAAAASYYTFSWIDTITYPPYEGPAPETTFDGSGSIEIMTPPSEPNILFSECTVSGVGYTGETTYLDGTITLMNTAYTLQSGYSVYLLLEKVGSPNQGWFITEDGPELNSITTEYIWDSSMGLVDAGTYTITIQMTGMVWSTP